MTPGASVTGPRGPRQECAPAVEAKLVGHRPNYRRRPRSSYEPEAILLMLPRRAEKPQEPLCDMWVSAAARILLASLRRLWSLTLDTPGHLFLANAGSLNELRDQPQ